MVWPRIDQKSCLKAIAAAGCVPLVVENLLEGDELRTDVAGVREKIASVGAEQVLGYTYYDRPSAILTMATLGGYTYYSYTTMAIPLWLYLPRLHSPRQVLCVLSTTSCFAPRGVERLLDLARICLELDVPHFVNNAYGVQCVSCMKVITEAATLRDGACNPM